MLSVCDLYRLGIGPSSSHTVGPMRIANRFAHDLAVYPDVGRVEVRLLGSLAFTGVGHGTLRAVALGLSGLDPETVATTEADAVEALQKDSRLNLGGRGFIAFHSDTDLVLDYVSDPELHPNAMVLSAWDTQGALLTSERWYSTGGGFIASHAQLSKPADDDRVSSTLNVPYPFHTGNELLGLCETTGQSIADLVRANEIAIHGEDALEHRLRDIRDAMIACIGRGLVTEGRLPGKLNVPRRAAGLWRKLQRQPISNEAEQLFDWLNVYAMAVNEENAAGGRVVTAPTNGAAGIIPAVLRHYAYDGQQDAAAANTFLLTAGGIGLLYKQRASISGAEMGCQGEVGVACSMAAAGLTALWNGTPLQVTQAAEIAMEHNLGLTCDPVGGLVQIPCIERNAIGAVKAVNAARLALHSHERSKVSLDQVIETMRQTGLDMSSKYKETSQGGLAVNVIEC